MNTNGKAVKEITDILKAADTVMSLVCLFKINRKANDLADKQRELEEKLKAFSKSKSKGMEDAVRTVSSLNKHAEEIVNDVRTKSALKKLKVEPERNVSDISTSDLLKYEELKKRYLEENEKMGIAINPSNDKFTEELRTRSNEA